MSEKLEINTGTLLAKGLQNRLGWRFLAVNVLMIL